MKTIGHKKIRSPEENLHRFEALRREAYIIYPKKKRACVLKFKTWEELYEYSIKKAALDI
jgi:hypothetical protein